MSHYTDAADLLRYVADSDLRGDEALIVADVAQAHALLAVADRLAELVTAVTEQTAALVAATGGGSS